MLAVIGIAAAGAFLVPNVVAGWWPGPVVRVPGRLLAEPTPGRLSIPIFVFCLLLLGIASAAIAVALAARGGRRRRLGFVALGLSAIAIGSTLFSAGGIADAAFGPDRGGVPRVSGAIAIASGVALMVFPSLPIRRSWLAPLIAAMPAIATVVALVFLAPLSETLPFGTADASWPSRVDGAGLAAGALVGVVTMAASLIGILFLWQSVAAAGEVTRQVAAVSGGALRDRPRVLAALLGAKAVWITAGYLGLLPALFIGRTAAAWSKARSDDLIAVGLALLFAVAVGVWLLRGARPRVTETGVPGAAAIFTLGFYLPFLLAGIALLLLPVVNLVGSGDAAGVPEGPGLADCVRAATSSLTDLDVCATRFFRELIPYAGLTTWLVALVFVVLAVLRRRWLAVATASGAILVWSAPVAIDLLVHGVDNPGPILYGKPELLTVDALLTVVVAILAVMWWTGRQRSATPYSLVLILVVSTLVANVGAFVPSGQAAIVIGAVLLAPIVYELLFESERLNRAGASRDELVPRVLGLQLAGLAFVVAAIAVDRFEAQGADLAELFIPPLAAVLVAAEISRREHRRTLPIRPRQLLPVVARWAAGGAAAAVIAAVVAGQVAGPGGPQTVPTSRATAHASFLQHVDLIRPQAAQSWAVLDSPAGTYDATAINEAAVSFLGAIEAAESWLAEHPQPDPCFADEVASWRSIVGSMIDIRDGAQANVDVTAHIEAMTRGLAAFEPGRSACQSVLP